MKYTKELVLKSCLYILPVLFIWQGLDFTDMGFLLSNALFFDQPGVIQDQGLAYFLTNFIGWLWLNLTSPLGLLGAKFGWCVIMWGTFYLSHKLLCELMPSWRAYAYLVVLFMFVVWTPWIAYNDFSALLALLSVCLIVSAETDGKSFKTSIKLLFFAGLCSGINVFTRLPNILMVSFALIPVVADAISRCALPSKKSFSKCGLFLLGWFAALVIVLMLMAIFGYFGYFMDTLAFMREMAHDPNGHHSSKLLLYLLKNDHILVFKRVCLFFFPVAVATLPVALIPRKSVRYVAAVVALCLLINFELASRNYRFYIYVMAGICYLVTLIELVLLCKKSKRRETAIYLSALGIFMLVPLGSNVGLHNVICSSWLLVPLVFEFIYNSPTIVQQLFAVKKPIAKRLVAYLSNCFFIGGRFMIIIPFVLISVQHAWTYTYRDSADRASMIYPIEHSKLRFIYTTKERAAVVNELLRELDGYVGKYEYLLASDSGTTLHYIYAWKPYLYSAWEMLYEPHQFEAAMRKAEQEHTLPLVVITKETLQTFNWPRLQNPWINNSARYKAGREIVVDFMARNNYSKQWENATFEIWTYD